MCKIYFYYDLSDQKKITKEFMWRIFGAGDDAEKNINNEQLYKTCSNDLPIMIVHRSWWEGSANENRERAISTCCKTDNNTTMLVVFTRAFDREYQDESAHEEWCNKYAPGLDPKRVCVLLDTELLKVAPKMVEYLKKTPVDEWEVEKFYRPFLPCPHLNALAILCQGYLAGHGVDIVKAEDLEKLRDGGTLPGLPKQANPTVTTGEYWNVFGLMSGADLQRKVWEEWENRLAPAETLDTVNALIAGVMQSPPEVTPTLVAQALEALEGALGGGFRG